jgi:hypothetical protein
LQGLNEERVAVNLPTPTVSPLNVVLERFANLHKTLGLMQADNESKMFDFMCSDTPIAKLLSEDLPAVANAKKDLEQLCRRQAQSQVRGHVPSIHEQRDVMGAVFSRVL